MDLPLNFMVGRVGIIL